ncbi:aquaporin [Mycobacterium sp. pUA109]|uniref:aquaporin n=1 Tax=Mycobacterium sp. pUA109 TaxID=3238982 RepID=UPI00351B98BB
MDARKLFAECLGTAILVFVGVGVATLSFGDWGRGLLIDGAAGCSVAAGVVATALAFGLVMLILAYALGPISGAHINPAVTIGFVSSGRMSIVEGLGYWVAQFVGGILGAAALYGIFHSSSQYAAGRTGLGTDGWGENSQVGIGWAGAFAAEAVLTFIFVLVVLSVTSRIGNATAAALAIGLALGAVHLLGIPLTGTGVNPARSLGPAILVGGDALAQLWLFIVAPLVGGVVAALTHLYLVPRSAEEPADAAEAAA